MASVPSWALTAEPAKAVHTPSVVEAPLPLAEPLFGDLRWVLLRRLESLPESQWPAGVEALLDQYGDPTRQALILLAGAPDRAGRTRAVEERSIRLRALALERVREGLRQAAPAWEKALEVGLDLRGLRAQGIGEPIESALSYRLACLRLAARLQRTDWAEAIAAHLLRRSAHSDAAVPQTSEDQPPASAEWESRMAHAEAQEALFHLFGVRFEDYEAFQEFPRLSAQVQPHYRAAFLAGAEREGKLQERLLRQSAPYAIELLSHPDAHLRRAAVQRMIEAVGEQALPLQEVLQHLQARLHEESSELVFDALLRAAFELALAAGPESRLAAELRASLYSLGSTIPTPLAATLMNGIERLPRKDGLPATDYEAATELLLDLFAGELRLDSDGTVQVLQAWGRLSAQTPEPDREKKARCEQRVLGLMVGAHEAERVRVAAAEALASAKIGAEALERIVQLLEDPESPDELRLDGYPLVKGAELTETQTQRLLDALMRDWGSTNADLATRALAWVGGLNLTEALLARERADGTPLQRAMEVLHTTQTQGLRVPLMAFVRDGSEGAGPRPDLLDEYLQHPIVATWLNSDGNVVADLAPMVRALAGPGDAHRLVNVARTWREVGPQPAPQNTSQQTTAAAVVAFQALALVASAEENAARLLDGATHEELCAWAYEHLVRTSRSASGALAKRIGARWLKVHLPAAQVHGESQGGGLAPYQIHHLKALLLAQQVGEDMEPAALAFREALDALPKLDGNQRARFRILRDQARFLDGIGSDGQGSWEQLLACLDPLDPEMTRTFLTDLDFSDLAAAARSAERREQHALACHLWYQRASSDQWRGLPPEAALEDLAEWARCAQEVGDPAILRRLLDFEAKQIQPDDESSSPDPGAAASEPSATRWLRFDADARATWGAIRDLLRIRLAKLEQAAAQDSETPSEDPPPNPDGEDEDLEGDAPSDPPPAEVPG